LRIHGSNAARGPQEAADQIEEAEALVLETLGADRNASLQATGAAMDHRRAVEYMRTEAERVLGHE
jgi:hypothetical protein